ncbi:MAG: M23 family metallopeptidase [Campylobacteraceae bacterium]|nr:M23 family metallopeptidase [Campylobacteraceae bacterium]
MFKKILVFFVLVLSLHAAFMEEAKWEKGETFLTFLEKHNIPLSLYYDLEREDKELASEILSGIKYQMLRDDSGNLEQVLIPIGEELQIHLVKNGVENSYEFRTTPISYQEEALSVTLEINLSPYQDIVNATNNYGLANEFVQSFKNSVNFRRLVQGDRLVVFYTQRTRLGQRFGNPKVQAAMVEVRGKPHHAFLFNENRYYDATGKEIEGFFLSTPVRYNRISSPFTYKRWHPILKRYRAHLGIDYAAPTGTPIKAAGEGKVTHIGTKNGYGKTIEINHGHGYKTLYAHMNGYRKGLKRGSTVQKGQIIGYVGSTGMSTGPHLHFGLYKDNRAINPNSVVKIEKDKLQGETLKSYLAHTKQYEKRFALALANPTLPPREATLEYASLLEQKTQNDKTTVIAVN